MTISELIERLEALKAEHGDCPVYVTEDEGSFKRDPEPEWLQYFSPVQVVI